ncbi:hypothetical protein CERSUDRAFT_78436 [Gelatoporia subvermispora B]|uniref:Uncharacterized protein n=1 Tax=Ceriporiopsis subvermispora (strain B) TaxID=914234 RepID=M2QYU6_CERS8|nr:hypothetical protein CERSUDRAFT_78436 [Gelatoporia subvermispora B]
MTQPTQEGESTPDAPAMSKSSCIRSPTIIVRVVFSEFDRGISLGGSELLSPSAVYIKQTDQTTTVPPDTKINPWNGLKTAVEAKNGKKDRPVILASFTHATYAAMLASSMQLGGYNVWVNSDAFVVPDSRVPQDAMGRMNRMSTSVTGAQGEGIVQIMPTFDIMCELMEIWTDKYKTYARNFCDDGQILRGL